MYGSLCKQNEPSSTKMWQHQERRDILYWIHGLFHYLIVLLSKLSNTIGLVLISLFHINNYDDYIIMFFKLNCKFSDCVGTGY